MYLQQKCSWAIGNCRQANGDNRHLVPDMPIGLGRDIRDMPIACARTRPDANKHARHIPMYRPVHSGHPNKCSQSLAMWGTPYWGYSADSCNTGEHDRHAQNQQPCLASRTLPVIVRQEQPVLSGTHWSSFAHRQMSVVLCLRRFPMKIENCHIRHQRPLKVHQRPPH